VSLSKLPSGRWRAQVHHPGKGHNVGVGEILGGISTFRTKAEAKQAREEARRRLRMRLESATVRDFAQRWTTDELFARPKRSTMIHNGERVRGFVERYGDLPLGAVTDAIVADWLAGGARSGTVPALRAMFNDAMSAKAGRPIDRNPFAKLGLARSRGNRDKQPPAEATIWKLIEAAHELACPSFAAWLQVGAYTGMRPGELDGLLLANVDFEREVIVVSQQYSATSREITAPKNGRVREAILTPPAREALLRLPVESEWAFVTIRGRHYRPSSRAYHWKAVRAAVGYTDSLYLATRHFAGWYMVNVLGLDSEDVAFALGHEDGGELVRMLYGHRDRSLALCRVSDAYKRQGVVRALPERRAS
jgi:integrase